MTSGAVVFGYLWALERWGGGCTCRHSDAQVSLRGLEIEMVSYLWGLCKVFLYRGDVHEPL